MSIHNYVGKPPLTCTLISYVYRPENWKSFDNVLNEMVNGLCEGEGGASWVEEHL